jgi:hypothetical protein
VSKFHDLAKKLQALAVGGVGGERDNAAKMLNDLCRKHGINLDSLFEKAPSERRIAVESDEHLNFIFQCLASVTDRKPAAYDAAVGGKRFFQAKLSDTEYLELDAKASFYWAIWQKERALFYSAFVQKHDLGAKPSGASQLSLEEIAEIRRKMQAMDAHTLHKQVGQ